MSQQNIMIVPVTLQRENKNALSHAPLNATGICTIKMANAEISFYNGVEERIIQTVIKELRHL